MKKFSLFCFIVLTLILVSGCNLSQPITNSQPNTNQISNSNQPQETIVSFLVPAEDPLKYCNGADMDSAGFRKTITKAVTKTITQTNLIQDQLVNKTLELAAQEANITFPQSTTDTSNYIKVIGETAYVQPIDAWAGVSIFLCYWKPFVEVNLLYLTNIKNVVWVNDWTQWDNLK
ncbi:MAG: hypothetical protein WC460_05460 [Patescibacteria group bacterium]